MLQVGRPAGKILVVDDSIDAATGLKELLTVHGYSVVLAHDGETGLSLVLAEDPDVVLLDIRLPGIDGFEVCRRLKHDPRTRLTPVVLVTALRDREDRITGIDAGADDFLTKPVDLHELRARVQSLVRYKRYTEDLDAADLVILNFALNVEARDPHTEGHCQRVASYATAVGVQLDLGDEDLAALHRGGFLHDIGKIAVPESILLKAGPLTPEERRIVERHSSVGDGLCGDLHSLKAVRPIVRHHHERLDGSGYPDGLSGDAIPLLAQILSIADAYDALTRPRPYQPTGTPEHAFDVLLEEAHKGWRRVDLVSEFVSLGRSGRLRRLADT